MIEIKEVKTKKDLKKFCKFVNDLYKNNPYYIPSLVADEMGMFLPEKNGAYEWSDVRLFLAYKDKKIVGRVAGIYNRKYIEKVGKNQMRITRFDFIDDKEVSKALIDAIKAWALELGAKEIIGPIGFSDLDKEGMLIEGFEEESMYITIYNDPYYIEHMEAMGFEKECEWVEYRIEIPSEPVPLLEKLAKRSMDKFGYKVHKCKTKKELLTYVYSCLDIMNQVYAKLYGYTELNTRQKDEFINNLGIILNTEYAYVVKTPDDKIVGYGLLAPSINRGMKKCNGKITIPGMITLLKDLKKNDSVDLYGIGVVPEYVGNGVNAIILNEGIKSCIKNGIKYAETGPELESNAEVQAQWKLFKHRQHKRRRCWILPLE